MLTLLALLCPPRFCMLPSWKFTTLYHAICNMYPHAQCWHSLLYCALHASACFCPWNSQPFLYQAVCYTYYILCYIPHTVLHTTYCATYHILCYLPHTVLHITYCATYHILCYIPHTVLNTYHILCYIPHNVLHTTYCATYHILYVSTCLILTVLALSCTPRFRMFVCW